MKATETFMNDYHKHCKQSSTVEDRQLVLFSPLRHDSEEIAKIRVEETLEHITVLF